MKERPLRNSQLTAHNWRHRCPQHDSRQMTLPKKVLRFRRGSVTESSSGSSASEDGVACASAPVDPAADVDAAARRRQLHAHGRERASDLAATVAARADQYAEAAPGAASPFAPGGLDPDAWDRVPQYSRSDLVVGKHLGTGSFSDAFEVLVPAAAKEERAMYALKRLRPQLRGDVEQFLIGIEDLIQETKILANLDHPHIVKLHGRAATAGATAAESVAAAFRLADGYFLLLDGLRDTLEDRVAAWRATAPKGSGRTAPPPARLAAMAAVSDAVAYLHARGLVYRDLKPANVGFDARGTPKLFDFGFAAALPDGDGRLRGACGTPRYMAPEVGLGKEYGTRADVHAFGVVLWEVCALRTAFAEVQGWAGMTRTVFEGGRRPGLARRWPTELKDVLRGCWRPEPEKRPAMEAVAALLKAHVESARQDNAGSLRGSSLLGRLRRMNK